MKKETILIFIGGSIGLALSKVIWDHTFGKKEKERDEAFEKKMNEDLTNMVNEAFPTPDFSSMFHLEQS